MREAVIVSTARTGIGRAYKGALNNTKSPSMLAHAIAHAVQRAGVDGAEVDDAVIGTVLGAGTAGMNVARNGVLAAGLPEEIGIDPVFAIPKLLRQHGLKVEDIGLWELNEAFACQALYCCDKLDIDLERYNVVGGGMGAAALFEVA